MELRLRARLPSQIPLSGESKGVQLSFLGTREIRWESNQLSCEVLEQKGPLRKTLHGPSLVFHDSSTIFVAPNWTLRGTESGHLLLSREPQK